MAKSCSALINSIRACERCADLPLGPKPILQFSSEAKILIAGQAPGRITHEKGIPFDDASGKRLRDWLGVETQSFYNPNHFAILPMAFCFPGTGKQGDLPPPPICAEQWRQTLLNELVKLQLIIVLGRYAIDWHCPDLKKKSVTSAVAQWRNTWPKLLVLPHPSPRNNRWLKNNPWFEAELLPELKKHIQSQLAPAKK